MQASHCRDWCVPLISVINRKMITGGNLIKFIWGMLWVVLAPQGQLITDHGGVFLTLTPSRDPQSGAYTLSIAGGCGQLVNQQWMSAWAWHGRFKLEPKSVIESGYGRILKALQHNFVTRCLVWNCKRSSLRTWARTHSRVLTFFYFLFTLYQSAVLTFTRMKTLPSLAQNNWLP